MIDIFLQINRVDLIIVLKTIKLLVSFYCLKLSTQAGKGGSKEKMERADDVTDVRT